MEFSDYNENLIISAGLNIQISTSIFLVDLLRLDYSQDIRPEFLKTYIKDISKPQGFKYIENLQNFEKKSVILLGDFSACVYSHKIFYITCSNQTNDISRANLNSFIELKNPAESLEIHNIPWKSGFSYSFVYFIKNLMKQGAEISHVLKSLSFDSIKSTTKNEVAAYIYANTKIAAKNLLFKINEAKELFQTDCSDLSVSFQESISNASIIECSSFKANHKPICDILIASNNRSSIVSLEYTISDDTGKAETSFRLSNTISGKFPRMSGSSITMLETHSKDVKNSFGEYIECMESPRFSSINVSPYKAITITPLTSPKQSIYSIQEVKNYLLPGIGKNDSNESPYEKVILRKTRSPGIRAFSFQDFETKSITTDVCASNDLNRSRTVFEEKKSSCQCQSCHIF